MLRRYHANTTEARGFEIYPAIDLREGRIVRLVEGDFARETTYSDDPVAVAVAFAAAGARWIHVVDLDGARTGERGQGSVVAALAAAIGAGVGLQVGGGIRDVGAAADVLRSGARRIVVGTAALRDPGFAGELVAELGADRVVAAVDVRDGLAVGDGWKPGAVGLDANAALDKLADAGVVMFAVTAIDRDGRLEGPDTELLDRLITMDRGDVIASGGVSSIEDLLLVREIGCAGAIVGRAMYEGRLDLGEALTSLSG